ncbi:hypothetical protein D3C73_1227370 [compost metagenome]
MQTAFGVSVLRIGTDRPKVGVRVFKQAHIIFGIQHVATGTVDVTFRYQPVLHQPRQVLVVIFVAHAHIDTGGDRQAYRIARVCGHAVFDQLFNRTVVTDGDALEAPLVAQQIFQQPGVSGSRNAVYRIERDHHPTAAGVNRGLIRRQVVLVHSQWTHIDGIVIATALGGTVQREVLHAGHD